MTGNNNINQYVDKKPIEIVQEVNNEIPSYEEFLKNYENDGNLNYADLSDGEVGEVKGYGPCSSCSGSNRNLNFKLTILLQNCMGSEKGMVVRNVDRAREEANKIIAETGHWEDGFLDFFSQEDRRKLANKIKEEISWHEKSHEVDTSVCNKESFDIKAFSESLELLDEMLSEPYPGERSGRGGFLD